MEKPVLYLDQTSDSEGSAGKHDDGMATNRGGDLFHCETDDEWEDEGGEVGANL